VIHDKFTDLHKNTRGNERYDAWTNKYVFITNRWRKRSGNWQKGGGGRYIVRLRCVLLAHKKRAGKKQKNRDVLFHISIRLLHTNISISVKNRVNFVPSHDLKLDMSSAFHPLFLNRRTLFIVKCNCDDWPNFAKLLFYYDARETL